MSFTYPGAPASLFLSEPSQLGLYEQNSYTCQAHRMSFVEAGRHQKRYHLSFLNRLHFPASECVLYLCIPMCVVSLRIPERVFYVRIL